MRKVLSTSVAALLVLAMAAVSVSAFESHLVNVTAHVANSLTVTANEAQSTFGDVELGPADPLSWLNRGFTVTLSQSFLDQSRVFTVQYKVCAETRDATFGTPGFLDENKPKPPNDDGFEFLWMGGSSFIEIQPADPPDPPDANTGPFHWIGPTASTDIETVPPPPIEPGIKPPPGGVECPPGAVDSLTTADPANEVDTVYLWWEVPVFKGVYIASDPVSGDTADKPRNDQADCGDRLATQPCVLLEIPPAKTAGTKLGLDLKIQVICIALSITDPECPPPPPPTLPPPPPPPPPDKTLVCEKGSGLRPQKLTMEYVGFNIQSHSQGAKVVVTDFGLGTTSPVFIRAFKSTDTWFVGTVDLNGTFDIDAVSAGKSKLAASTFVEIFDFVGGTLFQEIEFHTSCSQPLFIGDRFGGILLKEVLLDDGFTIIR